MLIRKMPGRRVAIGHEIVIRALADVLIRWFKVLFRESKLRRVVRNQNKHLYRIIVKGLHTNLGELLKGEQSS